MSVPIEIMQNWRALQRHPRSLNAGWDVQDQFDKMCREKPELGEAYDARKEAWRVYCAANQRLSDLCKCELRNQETLICPVCGDKLERYHSPTCY